MEKKEEFIELPEEEKKEERKIKIEKVIDVRDVSRTVKKVLDNKIVVANLREIKNIADFQNILKEFKRFSSLYKLNLFLIDENYLLITTKNISIEKV